MSGWCITFINFSICIQAVALFNLTLESVPIHYSSHPECGNIPSAGIYQQHCQPVRIPCVFTFLLISRSRWLHKTVGILFWHLFTVCFSFYFGIALYCSFLLVNHLFCHLLHANIKIKFNFNDLKKNTKIIMCVSVMTWSASQTSVKL